MQFYSEMHWLPGVFPAEIFLWDDWSPRSPNGAICWDRIQNILGDGKGLRKEQQGDERNKLYAICVLECFFVVKVR